MSTEPITPANALERGCSIIPIGIDKKPYFELLPKGPDQRATWKPYQHRRASLDELQSWTQANPPAYAIVTGKISARVTFDFDGEAGRQLALKWDIRPHRKTGGGGLHWDVQHPGRYVPTLNGKAKQELGRRWPGLDVKGDGGYAIAFGRNAAGAYEWLRDAEPDAPDLVPEEVWEFLRAHHNPEIGTPRKQASDNLRVDPERLIRMALDQVRFSGRNNAGFWLAQQLRDNQFSHCEAEAAMRHYCSRVPGLNTKGEPELYGGDEMLASLRSAYSGVMRAPWGPSKAGRLAGPQNFQTVPHATTSNDKSESFTRDNQTPGLLRYLQNDHGNSERIIALQGQDLLYCPPFKKWLVWDGRRWAVDIVERARRLAKNTMIEYLQQAIATGQEPTEKFARQSLDTKRITNALREAQDQVYVLPEQLDLDPYLANFLDCTVDLRTGELREHRREDLITKLVHFNYRPGAKCPRFMRFLAEVTGGGSDASEAHLERSGRLIDYLQRAFGYSLTGVTVEKAVFLLHGPKDNGKSTLLATFLKLLEEYAVLLQIDTLMIKPGGENNNTQADLADLRGARFVMTSETEEGQRLAEGKLKRITQGIGRIKACRKYENPIEFDETHKLWIDANHLPIVRGHDGAIWSRLHAVPMTVVIQNKDPELGAKLLAEGEGILAWTVAGAVSWYQKGLTKPPEVEQTNSTWRKDMDQAGRFIEECCVRGDFARVRARQLFHAYQRWAEECGEKSMTEKAFAERLKEVGIEKHLDNAGTEYLGIGVRHEAEEKSATENK